MEIVIAILEIARRLGRGMGPYLLIEILLAGRKPACPGPLPLPAPRCRFRRPPFDYSERHLNRSLTIKEIAARVRSR